MTDFQDIDLTVNGARVRRRVAARQHLADFLRDELELTGTHLGCEHGICGACTVRLDRVIVRGCLVLAVQADGGTVETVEGLSDMGALKDLQEEFLARYAAQCGFCTPGMLITAHALLDGPGPVTRAAIRDHLSGNLCRCTGYQAIVDAVEAVARRRGR
ncbi:MAG: (2Fe-2S)-binding protein [Alphaproteobacteria bacterium]|nr:(2Fe-2S)-binding protein [Alphaproteobacteria bacterium]